MAVYILGAGASCCTDAYSAGAAGSHGMGDFRPPVMADFFKVARSRVFPDVPMRNLDSTLKAVGLSVAALERHEAGCANIEHVLSFCDLLQRAIAHWAYGPLHRGRIRRAVWDLERALARRPFHFLYLPPDTRRLCRKVKGWPIFGQHPKRNLVRAAEALREASRRSRGGSPQSGLGGWESASFRLGLFSPIRDVFKAICEVYGPSSPYLSRGSPAPPGLCSNYWRFLENKVRADDTVITFNYDFLLDRVLEEKASLRPDERLGPLPTLFDTAHGPARFIKLHGSVLWWVERNWNQNRDYYLGNANAGSVKFRPFAEAVRNLGGVGCRWLPQAIVPQRHEDIPLARIVEPVIVPPTIAKEEHLARPEISQLWQQAQRDLSATDKIYVLGYSFPPTDEHVTDMTRAAAGDRPSHDYRGVTVTVVTRPNACKREVEDLQHRVRDALPGADKITVARDDSGNTIGFAEWVCMKPA